MAIPDKDPVSTASEPQPSDKLEDDFEEPMLYCPLCNQRLTSRKCKLLCERCGYFMSCADYY